MLESTLEFHDIDPEDELRRESLLLMGNGVISCRASAPEISATQGWCVPGRHYAGLYRAGWYDDAPRTVDGRHARIAALVNLPDPFGLTFSLDGGSWFGDARHEVVAYRHTMHAARGTRERRMTLDAGGVRVELHELRFVSMAAPGLSVLRWVLRIDPGSRDAARQLHIASTLHAGVENRLSDTNRDYEGRRLRTDALQHDASGRASVIASLPHTRRAIRIDTRTACPGAEAQWRRVDEDGVRGETIALRCTIDIPANGIVTIEKRAIVQTEEEFGKPECMLPGAEFDELLDAHLAAWRTEWSCVAMEAADESLQRELDYAAAHLLQTVSPVGVAHDVGVPARGWQESYFGQIFWDEIFVFPFFASHFPRLARGLLDYRFRRLDAARDHARRAGLHGAIYPWRSADSGDDVTPPMQINPLSGHWLRDDTTLQRHVGCAIAYNIWEVYLATGDRALLAGPGGETLLEIARFWSSLAEYDPARDRYILRGVVGPDEYHTAYPDAVRPGIANNAYTNVMAVWTLARGLELLALLGPEQADALRTRVRLDEGELQRWDELTRRMHLPFLDDGVLEQFDGYRDLVERLPADVDPRKARVDWTLEARGDSILRYQAAKQADVLMLLHLFPTGQLDDIGARLGYQVDEQTWRRTAEYYLPRMTHESSLSRMVCAGAFAHIDLDRSWRFFKEALHVDLDAPEHGGTHEGAHLCAMAGALDVLQRHYLGVTADEVGVRLEPAPPPALDHIRIAFCYRGIDLEVALHGKTVTLTVAPGARAALRVMHGAQATMVQPGGQLAIDCRD
jgi:trehalose/maltose hydrolase-like predicted phosphorylase